MFTFPPLEIGTATKCGAEDCFKIETNPPPFFGPWGCNKAALVRIQAPRQYMPYLPDAKGGEQAAQRTGLEGAPAPQELLQPA